MARTRIRCPLCGHLVYQSTFEKGPFSLKAMVMKGLGRGHGFSFSKVANIDFLFEMKDFLVERVKQLYKHLTGTDIDELEEIVGGELERLKLSTASIRPVKNLSSLKMEQPLFRRRISVPVIGNQVKNLTISTTRLPERVPAQSLSQNHSLKTLKKVQTFHLVD